MVSVQSNVCVCAFSLHQSCVSLPVFSATGRERESNHHLPELCNQCRGSVFACLRTLTPQVFWEFGGGGKEEIVKEMSVTVCLCNAGLGHGVRRALTHWVHRDRYRMGVIAGREIACWG